MITEMGTEIVGPFQFCKHFIIELSLPNCGDSDDFARAVLVKFCLQSTCIAILQKKNAGIYMTQELYCTELASRQKILLFGLTINCKRF